MDESTLIQAAKRGDVESFNRLVLAYQDTAYTVAYRIMGEPDAAADATQEAFISAYQKLHQFRGEHFKPWLMRIVTNACYDELRRRQRRPALSLDELHEVQAAAGLDLHSPQENPEQHAQRRELNSAIQDCLSRSARRSARDRRPVRCRGIRLPGNRGDHRPTAGNGQIAPEPGTQPSARLFARGTGTFAGRIPSYERMNKQLKARQTRTRMP